MGMAAGIDAKAGFDQPVCQPACADDIVRTTYVVRAYYLIRSMRTRLYGSAGGQIRVLPKFVSVPWIARTENCLQL